MATEPSGPPSTAPPVISITQGGRERVPQALPILTAAFHNDPIFNYFMGALKSEEERSELLPRFIGGLLRSSTFNGGIVLEVSSWGCCAVMMPPGKRVDSTRAILQAGLISVMVKVKPTGLKRVLVEHGTAVKRAKKAEFTRQELSQYWYVFIIGTDPGRQRQGLGGQLLEHMKAHAARDDGGRPLWLEASNPNARALYIKHGFREVEEITLGKGLVGPDGLAKTDGEGVKTWGMVWRPES